MCHHCTIIRRHCSDVRWITHIGTGSYPVWHGVLVEGNRQWQRFYWKSLKITGNHLAERLSRDYEQKKGTAQVRPSDLTRSLSNIHDRVCSPVDELSSSTSGLGRRNQFITWVISLRTGRLWIQCLNQSLWDQSLIRRSRRTCADLEHLIRFIGLGATCTDGALGNESQKCGLCVTTHGGHSVSYQLEFCQTFFLPICKTSHTTKHWVRRF